MCLFVSSLTSHIDPGYICFKISLTQHMFLPRRPNVLSLVCVCVCLCACVSMRASVRVSVRLGVWLVSAPSLNSGVLGSRGRGFGGNFGMLCCREGVLLCLRREQPDIPRHRREDRSFTRGGNVNSRGRRCDVLLTALLASAFLARKVYAQGILAYIYGIWARYIGLCI